MKTAMQELIEWMEHWKNKPFSEFQQSKIKELLEKEKEQIKRAFEFGVADAYNFIEDEAEQFYNQPYNQKENNPSKTLLEILELENEKNIINEIFEKKDK